MVWSDLEIPQTFIVVNNKENVNFNTGLDFLGSCSNCVIFKWASKNSNNEFHSTCGSKDVAIC